MQCFQAISDPLTGINLIEASAGTGKTYTLSTLFVRLIVEQQRAVSQILVVTFTEAATEELRARIRRHLQEAKQLFEKQDNNIDPLLSQWVETYQQHQPHDTPMAIERLNNAVRGFDEAAVFTIHGFCRRMLQEQAFESGVLFDAELIQNQNSLLVDIVADFWRQHFYQNDLWFIEYALNEKTSPSSLQKLLKDHSHHPFLQIIPQVSLDDAALTATRTAYQTALAQVKNAWPQVVDEMQTILRHHPSLNRNKYNAQAIETLLMAMTLWAGQEDGLFVPDKFEFFAVRFLHSALKKNQPAPEHPFFCLAQNLLDAQAALLGLYQQKLLHLKHALFSEAHVALIKRKQQGNLLHFNDLLVNLYQALHGNNAEILARGIRQKFPAVLIDEFQDTDPLQYAIFRRIYQQQADITMFLIGDPKQAIYSFRGADIFTYLQAAADADRRYTLGFNWRSSPPLCGAVNRLFGYAKQPFLFDNLSFHPVQAAHKPAVDDEKDRALGAAFAAAPLRLWWVDDRHPVAEGKRISKARAQQFIPAWVAEEIIVLLQQHASLSAGDVAILTRSNRQAQQMQAVLRQRAIPSVLFSRESLFDSFEAVEMQRLLAAIVDCDDEGKIKAALTTDMLGMDGGNVQRLTTDDAAWNHWLLRFRHYHGLWKQAGFIAMFRLLLHQAQVGARLLALVDGERRLTNVLHLSEVLQQASMHPRRSMDKLYQWLVQQCQQQADDDVYQLRLESDDNAVKLVTVHKSKGLEYPVVFVPYAWDGKLNSEKNPVVFHPQNASSLTLDLGSAQQEDHRLLAQREELAENLRLLYVAVTRAKYCCYLLWGMFNGAETAALGYLLHQQADDKSHERVKAYLKNIQQDQWQEDLNRFQIDGIQLCSPPENSGQLYVKPSQTQPQLAARSFNRPLNPRWQITSFSHIAHDNHGLPALWQTELADRDWQQWPTPQPHIEPSPASTIAQFPTGTKAGLFFHDALEHIDFQDIPDETWWQQRLQQHGFSDQWHHVMGQWLTHFLNTPLHSNLCLAQISKRQRLNELEFYFSVDTLDLSHKTPWAEYMARQQTSTGFVKGFIDLLFEHQGHYYLIDYKSNHLGDGAENYAPEQLLQVMQAQQYDLQALIYTVAVHRYLTWRLPHYDYQQHFAGVYCLFLRGMHPNNRAGHGVFFQKPAWPALAQSLKSLSIKNLA